MTDPGSPRHGRHSSPDEAWSSDLPSRTQPPPWAQRPAWAETSPWAQAPREEPTWPEPSAWEEVPRQADDRESPTWESLSREMHAREAQFREVEPRGPSTVEYRYPRTDPREWAAAPRRSGLLERSRAVSSPDGVDETGPLEWRHRPEDGDDRLPPAGGQETGPLGAESGALGAGGPRHPSSPLPPMPRSVWSKLSPQGSGRGDDPNEYQDHEYYDDADVTAGAGHRELGDGELPTQAHEPYLDSHDDGHLDGHDDWDRTGGLEVLGAHVDEQRPRGPFRRSRRSAAAHPDDDLHEDLHDDRHDDRHDADLHDGEIPIAAYDPRPRRRRRRRRRVGLIFSLVVLIGLAGGAVVGGQRIIGLFVSADYSGSGTGSVHIRIKDGDTLTAIGQTLVHDGVIASVPPFKKAAEANPSATGIAPGVYGLRRHMSGKAALDLLLKPSSRLVSHVTLPEGVTVKQTLQRLAQGTGVPIDQLQAAAANPAALGLPAYANGSLEGFLFPATYDFEPGTTAAQMLTAMIKRTVQTLDDLEIPEAQRLTVLTKASIVQAESGSAADMPKVARVIENRLAIKMPLQLDTTVNYANGKTGLTTSDQDRANPSPYNTYLHAGLPPGPIDDPGEQALRAVLAPAQGNWLYFVVVNPDTGETRFAATAQEHQQNVALFQQWLRQHPDA